MIMGNPGQHRPGVVRLPGDGLRLRASSLFPGLLALDLELPGEFPGLLLRFTQGRGILVTIAGQDSREDEQPDSGQHALSRDRHGSDPRALAVSPDGRWVYVTIFESGNGTTLLRQAPVSDPRGPYESENFF